MARVSRLRFISPQLPSLTEHPPEGANWIHEVKHYGSPKSQHKKCVEFRLLIQVTPHDTGYAQPRWWLIFVIAVCIALGAIALHLAKYPPPPVF